MIENNRQRVVVVGEREEMRRAAARILGREGDIEVVGEIDAVGVPAAGIDELDPDVLVIDCFSSLQVMMARFNGVITGLPGVRVVMICPWNDSRYALWALSAGASAYVLTDRASRDLAGAVRAAVQHRYYVSSGIAGIPERG